MIYINRIIDFSSNQLSQNEHYWIQIILASKIQQLIKLSKHRYKITEIYRNKHTIKNPHSM